MSSAHLCLHARFDPPARVRFVCRCREGGSWQCLISEWLPEYWIAVKIFINALILYHKDKIPVGILGVWVRNVNHANSLKPLFNHLAYLRVHLGQLIPGHRAFQRVDQDPVIHQVFAHVGVSKAGLLPLLCKAKRRRHHRAVPLVIFGPSPNLSPFMGRGWVTTRYTTRR